MTIGVNGSSFSTVLLPGAASAEVAPRTSIDTIVRIALNRLNCLIAPPYVTQSNADIDRGILPNSNIQ
jgi:hypothetical protein